MIVNSKHQKVFYETIDYYTYIFITSEFFKSLIYLEIAIAIRQVHKRFIKLPITLLFWHDATCYKVFGQNFSLYLEGPRFLYTLLVGVCMYVCIQ